MTLSHYYLLYTLVFETLWELASFSRSDSFSPESYQAILLADPAFPASRAGASGACRGFSACLKGTLWAVAILVGTLLGRRKVPLNGSLTLHVAWWVEQLDFSATPMSPCLGAFSQCTKCTTVPSGLKQRHALHLHPDEDPPPVLCAG